METEFDKSDSEIGSAWRVMSRVNNDAILAQNKADTCTAVYLGLLLLKFTEDYPVIESFSYSIESEYDDERYFDRSRIRLHYFKDCESSDREEVEGADEDGEFDDDLYGWEEDVLIKLFDGSATSPYGVADATFLRGRVDKLKVEATAT